MVHSAKFEHLQSGALAYAVPTRPCACAAHFGNLRTWRHALSSSEGYILWTEFEGRSDRVRGATVPRFSSTRAATAQASSRRHERLWLEDSDEMLSRPLLLLPGDLPRHIAPTPSDVRASRAAHWKRVSSHKRRTYAYLRLLVMVSASLLRTERTDMFGVH